MLVVSARSRSVTESWSTAEQHSLMKKPRLTTFAELACPDIGIVSGATSK